MIECLDDTAEMFGKAGILFKKAKEWARAGDAFSQVAQCRLQIPDGKHEAAVAFTEAANAFKKTSPKDAIEALKSAAELYEEAGRFTSAAKSRKEAAELHEEAGDLDAAIELFRSAGETYSGEGATSQANAAFLKVALFSAQQEKYEDAYTLYEKVASAALDNNLLKFSAKDYFMRAALCRLATEDDVGTRRQLEKYCDMDPTFVQSREYKLLSTILAAREAYDVDKFTQAVYDFDNITKLDAWKTTMLLRIKKTMKDGDGEGASALL